MENENNFIEGTTSQPKQNKKKLIILIAAVLVVLLVGGGVYAAINSNPKVKVLKALKATGDDFKNKQTLIEKITGKDYLKDLEEKGTKQNMKFTMNSTNIPELLQMKGSGLSMDSLYDIKNKKFMLNVGGIYKGTSLVDAQFYTDNKKLMISSPKLYNAWFTCDAEKIQEQYNTSVFAQNGKAPNQEITMKFFDDEKQLAGKELADTIQKGYLKANEKMLTTIGENIKVEKSKQDKNIEIGGVSEACTGYDVIISGEDTKAIVESIYDYMLEDPEVKKVLTKSLKYSYMQYGKYNSPEAMVDDMYKQMKDARDKFKNSFTCENINAVVYIDKKDRAVGIDINTVINANNQKLEVKYSSDCKGKDNVADIIDMSMELTNNGEKIKLDFDSSSTTKGDAINEDMNLVIDLNKLPVSIKTKTEYNTKSGDFNGSLDLNAQGQGINASCNGNSKYDKSNKSLQLNFDKIDLRTNVDSKNVTISLDGSYTMAPIDKAIEEPTGEKLELFKLDKNKIVEIGKDIQKNTMGLASAFYK